MSKHGIDIDIGAIILQKLKEKERSIAWLAKKIKYDRGNLNRMLNNSHLIYYDLIYKISKAMEEDFFAYGSQKLKETQQCEIDIKTM